jgi:hypothetical protein
VTDAAADRNEAHVGVADEVPVVFVCTFEEGRFRHDRMYADFARLSAVLGGVL